MSNELFEKILFYLTRYPLISKQNHPAEEYLSQYIQNSNIVEDLNNLKNDTLKSDFIKLLTRTSTNKDIQKEILKTELNNPFIIVRDACVFAFEEWFFENRDLIMIVKNHDEKVEWLNQYIHQLTKEYDERYF
jgi:hypothetical protein